MPRICKPEKIPPTRLEYPHFLMKSHLTPAEFGFVRVALAGNPNAGKSTLFNVLTGSRQHVGNWPGKTVEKKTGFHSHLAVQVAITDLPGTYSLSAYSLEEIIARDFILEEQPDAILAVVDAANLERNLYLVVQLLELEKPIVVVLNMMDVAVGMGITFDVAELSRALHAPVILTTARKAEGIDDLLDTLFRITTEPDNSFHLDYGPEIEAELEYLEEHISRSPAAREKYPARWLAIKLLEGDADIAGKLQGVAGGPALLTTAELARARLDVTLGDEIETLIAERRYQWIHDLVSRALVNPRLEEATLSDQIDRLATHRWLGIPLFLLTMWVVFKITIDLSAPWVDWIDAVLSGPVNRWAAGLLSVAGLGETWVVSLVVDGLLTGVGAVLAFIPVLLALYFALAVLEDSGYMARGAFVMDRLMNRIGLHGRSFLPLMVGFGCSVPAIYATRTLTNQRDRLLTGLLVPFMSCAARLPVYVLFAAIFFPRRASFVILILYLLGILVALAVGLILQRTLLRPTDSPGLVMELPPYRLPHGRSIWFHMWQRTRAFLQHAASLILITSMFIWLLIAIPAGGSGSFADTPIETSVFGRLSAWLAPALQPLGFGSWQASGALISGLVAKEVVVSTLAQTYAVDPASFDSADSTAFAKDLQEIAVSFATAVADTVRAIPSLIGIDLNDGASDPPANELSIAIRTGFDASSDDHAALAGLAFMIFVLVYTPCMAALAAERQELGTKWMWLSLGGQLVLAWLLALVVFQGGLLLGIG